MDIQIDARDEEHSFGLYCAAEYEITFGGLSILISPEQFQQLCDHLRPWIVEPTTNPTQEADK